MSYRSESEIESGSRFAFGENWSRFLTALNDDRIRLAEQSLRDNLEVESLPGKRFLDIGCGSGLFSLAARRLGAIVRSFDYDPQSVACTAELKRRYFRDDPEWKVEEGSVLDNAYLESLEQWDVVYSWGVLHHTGNMWRALDNVSYLVRGGGKLFIAIYNDQGRASRRWLKVKRAYNRLPASLRWLVLWYTFLRLWGRTTMSDLIRRRPFYAWHHYAENGLRGMSPWCDVVDWAGGLPFEVATPGDIFNFYHGRGFVLQRMKTDAAGHGNNEFVFQAQPF
jgi:2-polyprenyl-6-hydroxyphenyl methylase/3-demethylubiquinone-9 3-methyltransferase